MSYNLSGTRVFPPVQMLIHLFKVKSEVDIGDWGVKIKGTLCKGVKPNI